jgi:hypothetical protein
MIARFVGSAAMNAEALIAIVTVAREMPHGPVGVLQKPLTKERLAAHLALLAAK